MTSTGSDITIHWGAILDEYERRMADTQRVLEHGTHFRTPRGCRHAWLLDGVLWICISGDPIRDHEHYLEPAQVVSSRTIFWISAFTCPREGFEVEIAKSGHYRVSRDGRRVLTMPATPSDWRSMQKIRRDLCRLGVTVQ